MCFHIDRTCLGMRLWNCGPTQKIRRENTQMKLSENTRPKKKSRAKTEITIHCKNGNYQRKELEARERKESKVILGSLEIFLSLRYYNTMLTPLRYFIFQYIESIESFKTFLFLNLLTGAYKTLVSKTLIYFYFDHVKRRVFHF